MDFVRSGGSRRSSQEIAKIESGEWPADDNPLKNAPHTQLEVCASEWTLSLLYRLQVFFVEKYGFQRFVKFSFILMSIVQGHPQKLKFGNQ